MVKGYDQVGEGNSWQSGRVHLQGDLGQLPDGRGGVPVAGRLVPPAGDRPAGCGLPRPLPALVRRPGHARQPQSLPVAQRGPPAPAGPRADRHPDRRLQRGAAPGPPRRRRVGRARGRASGRDQLPRRGRPDRGGAPPRPSASACNRSSRSRPTAVRVPRWRRAKPSSSSVTWRSRRAPVWWCRPSGTTTARAATPTSNAIAAPATRLHLTRSHVFDEPGTYFVTLRAASQRDGAVGSPYGKAPNLARVRVVVS